MREGVTLTFVHGDHLGSASLTTGITGTKVSEMRYYPFGEVRWQNGTIPTDRTFTGHQSEASGLGSLVNMKAREYSPILGRFLSADSVVPQVLGSQSLNRYAYASNSPILLVDPDGHAPSCSVLLLYGCAGSVISQVGPIDAIETNFQRRNQYLLHDEYTALGTKQIGDNGCGLVASGPLEGHGDWIRFARELGELAGKKYDKESGIQPSDLVEALDKMLLPGTNLVAHKGWTLDELSKALGDNKAVIVDIRVGSLNQTIDKNKEFPTTLAPNFAHFVRVLAIDFVQRYIYLENTLIGQDTRSWKINFDDFLLVWSHPEADVSSRPINVDDVDFWAMVYDHK